MTQQELKTKIENNCVDDSCIILKYTDNTFICMDYAKAIARDKQLKVLEIDSLEEIKTSQADDDLFDSVATNYLYIFKTQDFNAPIDEILKYRNLIIICNKVSDKLAAENCFVEIAPLVNWQIEEYLKMRLPGLIEPQIKWLCEVAKYNIYRLDSECRKLEIFPPASQSQMFDSINREDGYLDLNNLSIFDLTNAVMKKDYSRIDKIMSKLKFIDVEPVGLVTIFKQQLRKLIDIQLNPRATAADLGMNPKQFSAIKYSLTGVFNQSQLVNAYDFITEIDFKLKNGDLQFSKNLKENNYMFIDYIIAQMLAISSDQRNAL